MLELLAQDYEIVEETILPVGRMQRADDMEVRLSALRAATDLMAQAEAAMVAPSDWFAQFRTWRHAFDETLSGLNMAHGELIAQALIRETPALAALMSQAGILGFQPIDGNPFIDTQRLMALLSDPTTVVTPDFWEELFSDTDDGAARARRIAIGIALLIVAPQTALALRHDELVSTAPPERRARNSQFWDSWHSSRDGWVSFTLPLRDPSTPEDQSTSVSMFDLAPGVEPDIALTIAIRVVRRPDDTDPNELVTDFEFWIGFSPSQSVWEHTFDNGWRLKIEPGVAVGVGRVGSVDGAQWHAAYNALDVNAPTMPSDSDPFRISLDYVSEDGQPDFVFGPPYDTRLEIGEIGAELVLRETRPVFEIGAYVQDLSLVLSARAFRTMGMIMSYLDEGLSIDGGVDLRYFEDTGFAFEGGAVLEVPINLKGVFKKPTFALHRVLLRAGLDMTEGEFTWFIEALAHMSVQFGPIQGVVDNIGIRIDTNTEFKSTQAAALTLADFAQQQAEAFTDEFIETLELGNANGAVRTAFQQDVAQILHSHPPARWNVLITGAAIEHFGGQVIDLTIETTGLIMGTLAHSFSVVINFLDELEDLIVYPTGLGIGGPIGPAWVGGYLDYTGGPTNRYGGLVTVQLASSPFDVLPGMAAITGAMLKEDIDGESSFISSFGVSGLRWPVGMFVTFDGFGAIVGQNRTADTDKMREMLLSGALGNVLFRGDNGISAGLQGVAGITADMVGASFGDPTSTSPLRNAPELIRDLDALFPAELDDFVFGPTVKFKWFDIPLVGALLVGDFGLVLTGARGPSMIVLLGSARSILSPLGIRLHSLRLDGVGVIDFARPALEVDASIISTDSIVMMILVATGDATIRIGGGSKPHFIVSIGGFHPSYEPENAVMFHKIERIAATLPAGGLMDFSVFRAEAYVALVSTSFQFGGRFELNLGPGSLHIQGFYGIDALFQVSPFFFDVSFHAGFRVRFRSISLASLQVSGQLRGPGPLEFIGRLTIEVLFFKKRFKVEVDIGEMVRQVQATINGLLGPYIGMLTDQARLVAGAAADAGVLIQRSFALDSAGRAIVSPVGGLSYTQSELPFGLPIDKVGSTMLDQTRSISIEVAEGEDIRDWFATPNFLDLTAEEAFDLPEFERQRSGKSFATQEPVNAPGTGQLRPVRTRVIRLPEKAEILGWVPDVIAAAYSQAIADGRGAARVNTGSGRVTVRPLGRDLVFDHTGQAMSQNRDMTAAEAHAFSRTLDTMASRQRDAMPDTQRPQASRMTSTIEAGDRIEMGDF
ncbi:MAG: DUF6603 domain-containing protein [Pseudomonadota bacterium]